jgi:hypothetical protein
MSTTPKSVHRSIASLKLPIRVPLLITYAQAIVRAMTGNASFPTPVPALAAVTGKIDDLQVAETAALARTRGAVTTRNEKRAALVQELQQLRGCVQATADANADNAASIIQSAGMALKKTAVRPPRVFAAKPAAVSGSVELVTHAAARRASYQWEYSTDGGKTWVLLPATLQTKTVVSGLAPAATVSFRYRPVTKGGEGDWSQPTSLIVK